MKGLQKALFLVPLFAAVVTAPAAAQSWKWDFGVNVGYSHFTNSLGKDQTKISTSSGGSRVRFSSGLMYGSQLGVWFNPKLGLRLNGRYADRNLDGNDMSTDLASSVNLWSASADLLFRLREPAPEFRKWEMLPYLALGLGAKWHNGAGDAFTCQDSKHSYNCTPFVLGIPLKPTAFAMGEENAPLLHLGLGADWRLARNVAIRTELSDQIFKPQFHTATRPVAPATVWRVGDPNIALYTHELGAQVGLHFLFGVAAPPVVAVVLPPPPPPPPPAPPEVRREALSVCVVDPAAPGGIRMQQATLIEGRDTVVMVSGSDRPFRESVGNVMVATNADWYVQGRPLTMTIGTGKAEFATYGTPRMIMGSDLAYLGTVNGYPVYADRDDVKDVINELNDLRAAQAGKDLGEILDKQKDLRNAMENVKVLYVPTNATGCVFQAVQRQEEVRKGK